MVQQTVIWTIVCLGALALALRRPRLGRVVLGVFFIVIAPLGPWTLPNLIMAAALGVILWRMGTAVPLAKPAM
jgi:hypothetical protein